MRSDSLQTINTAVVDIEHHRSMLETLEKLGDEVMVLDMAAESIAWISSQCAQRFTAFQSGVPATELFGHFVELEACLSCEQQQSEAANKQQCSEFQDNLGRTYLIERLWLDVEVVMLRFNDLAAQRSGLQRYLEDREKLFSTSRTISVSEMATTLAHEINQPIGTIKNLLQGIRARLQKSPATDDAVLNAMERAIEQTRFAARIISRIRDYTKSKTPEKSQLDLYRLVRECISLLDWEIDHQAVNCQIDLPATTATIAGDELMLQQVFVNLLRNAMDAMRGLEPERQQLLISSTVSDGSLTINIQDSGCGLNEETGKNLFQPFVSSKPTGMGVGLNICRSFVELHQGRLWLTVNEDIGCTAHVQLPEMNRGHE
jgi:signal transduction histidine kinase